MASTRAACRRRRDRRRHRGGQRRDGRDCQAPEGTARADAMVLLANKCETSAELLKASRDSSSSNCRNVVRIDAQHRSVDIGNIARRQPPMLGHAASVGAD